MQTPLNIPLTVALALISELYELGGLDDTRENIEAPSNQLNLEGRFIQQCLHYTGIKTEEQVRELEIKLLQIFKL